MKLCKDLKVLNKIQGHEVVSAWGEIDGYSHKEYPDGTRNSLVNQVSRAKIRAMRPCVIVHVNLYKDSGPTEHYHPYTHGMVYNFGGSFVIKEPDAELLRLLKERTEAEYTGVMDDAARVDKIYARMDELGGEILSWY